jgi:hypothetical protein
MPWLLYGTCPGPGNDVYTGFREEFTRFQPSRGEFNLGTKQDQVVFANFVVFLILI